MNIRRIRKARGLTMKQLGELVGVTESAIGQYETGRRKPNYEMLLKISEALGCTVNDLLLIDMKEVPVTVDDELAERLQILKDRPDLRALLDVTEGLTPERVARITAMIEGMKEG